MFSLRVFLNVEKDTINLLQADVESLQYGSGIRSVQG